MASSAISSPETQRGFTLIELLVVLAILAGMMALVVPRLSLRSGPAVLRAAASELGNELRLVRSAAIASDSARRLAIDPKRHRFAAEGARPHLVPAALQMRVLSAEGERLPDGTPAIRFFPDGSSTGGGVEIAGPSGAVTVEVDWLTGRVSLLERRN